MTLLKKRILGVRMLLLGCVLGGSLLAGCGKSASETPGGNAVPPQRRTYKEDDARSPGAANPGAAGQPGAPGAGGK